MTSLKSRALTASASAIALLSLAALHGQAQAAAAAPSASGAPEVIVTGERRPQKLQKVPIATTVLSGAQLQARGVTSLDSLQYAAPSITVTNLVQVSNINIRGIGKGDTGIQNVAGVIPYWDGVAAFPSLFQDEPYYDIANIEVDRGPQGTFGGSAATGGAVFVTTNNPEFSGPHAFIEGQVGNYNDYGLQATVNLPVNDDLALRLATNFESRDSFFKVTHKTFLGLFPGDFRGNPGRLLVGNARLSVLWKPTDALRVLLKAEYNYVDLGGYPGSDSSNPLNETQPNPRSAFRLNNNTDNNDVDRFGRVSLDVSYVFHDGITLRSISGYQTGLTVDATDLSFGNEAYALGYLPALAFRDGGTQTVWSEEVNLVSPSTGPLKWVVGGAVEADVTDIRGPDGFNSYYQLGSTLFPAIALTAHAPRDNEAVFGQITYDLDPQWTIIAGGRYSWSSNKLIDSESVFFPPPFPPGIVGIHATTNETVRDAGFTGKVAINYHFNPNNMAYAFVATGHKAAGLNTTPDFLIGSHKPAPFKGEDVTDFEVGLKSTLFDGHVRTQVGGYYTLYNNFQVNYQDPTLNLSLLKNVTGQTVLYGLEAQIQAVFGPWTFDANASVSHSRLGHFVTFDPCAVPTAGVVDPRCGLAGGLVDVVGNEQDYAPDATFNAGAQYAFALSGDATLTPRVDYSYVAPQWGTIFERPVDRLGARNLVNAQLTYQRGTLGIQGYATNLFDERYNQLQSEGGARLPGAPQQFGVRVFKSF
jgi:iron complex outermembrane receptor protein